MQTSGTTAYSSTARRLHWWTVLFLIIQIPLGFAMAYRGNTLDIWDATTDRLYSGHKLLGMVLLILVLVRLVYRLKNGAPADEPTLNAFEKFASHATHWTLYLLLILVPLVGWLGISLYGAREVFGVISIPGLMPQNTDAAAQMFMWHKLGAIAVILVAGMHIAAALFHYLIKKDGVLARMLPVAGKRP